MPACRLPLVTLLALTLPVYLAATRWPALGLSAVLAMTAALLALALANPRFFGEAVLGLCALIIIVYPGLLPHPVPGRVSPVSGGSFDTRAAFQLVIVAALALAAGWLWFSARGSLAAFGSAPCSLLAAYCVLVLLSLTYTPDKGWAAFAALKLIEAVLTVAALAVLIRDGNQLRRAIDVMLGSIGVVLLFYWLDIATGAAYVDRTQRLKTSWMSATDAGILAAVFAVVLGTRFLTDLSPWRAHGAGLLAGLAAFTALIIGGKASLVAGAAALPVIVLAAALHARWHLLLPRLVPAGLALALIGAYVFWENVGIAAHLRAYEGPEALDADTLTGRLPVWHTALDGMRHRPVAGHGYMSTFATGLEGFHWTAASAHNVLVQAAYDLGLLGVALVLAIYAWGWWSALSQLADRRLPEEGRAQALEMLGALLVLTLSSATEDIFGGVFEARTMVFLLVLFALGQNPRVARHASHPSPGSHLPSRISHLAARGAHA